MKKINIKLICAIAIIAIASAHSAYAQSPFNKLKGLVGGKKDSGGAVDVEKDGDELVRKYVKINKALADVIRPLAIAQGFEDEAEDLKEASDAMVKNPGKKEMQKVLEISEAIEKKRKKKSDDSIKLTAKAKKELSKTIPDFIVATVEAVELPKAAKRWADGAKAQMKGLGALKLRKKLETPLFIAPRIPKDLKIWTQTATRLVGISKKHASKDVVEK